MDAKLGQDSYRALVQYGELLRDGMREGFQDEFDIWNERYATYAQSGSSWAASHGKSRRS